MYGTGWENSERENTMGTCVALKAKKKKQKPL